MKYKNHLIIELVSFEGENTTLAIYVNNEGVEASFMITDLEGESTDYGYTSIEEAKKAIDLYEKTVLRIAPNIDWERR